MTKKIEQKVPTDKPLRLGYVRVSRDDGVSTTVENKRSDRYHPDHDLLLERTGFWHARSAFLMN